MAVEKWSSLSEKVLLNVLRANWLYDSKRKRRIEVPQSSDATNITKNVFIAMA
jgi:hypothetical protein